RTLEGRPNATMIQTLQGQVPGLNISSKDTIQQQSHNAIALRKNLSETAFFYPHLQFNKKGEVTIDFTAPEALPEWKFRGLPHNKHMTITHSQKVSKTQRDVMTQPNLPRFVREKQDLVSKARVSNTSAKPMNATAMSRLFNTIT